MTALIELLGRLVAAVRGSAAKQAAAELPRGRALNTQIAEDLADIRSRKDGNATPR